MCAGLQLLGFEVPVKIFASSAFLRYTRDAAMGAVDPGHILLGQTPPGPVAVAFDLRPAFRALTSRLIHMRRIEFRDLAPVPLRDNLRIGVIPIGLRDGIASVACGSVLVSGRRVPILRPISLELTRVDLTDVPQAWVGDEVAIVGRQGAATIRLEEVTAHRQLAVKPEPAMAIRGSVQRVYL